MLKLRRPTGQSNSLTLYCSEPLLSPHRKFWIAVAAGITIPIVTLAYRFLELKFEEIYYSMTLAAAGGVIIAAAIYASIAALSSCWGTECRNLTMFHKGLTAPLVMFAVTSQSPVALSEYLDSVNLFPTAYAETTLDGSEQAVDTAVSAENITIRSLGQESRWGLFDGFKIAMGFPVHPAEYAFTVGKYYDKPTAISGYQKFKEFYQVYSSKTDASMNSSVKFIDVDAESLAPSLWEAKISPNQHIYYVTIGAFGDKHKAQALGVTYAAIAHQYIAWSTERPDLFPAMKFPFGGIYSKKRLVSPSAAETDLRPPPTSD